MQETLLSKVTAPKNTRRDTPKTRTPLFPNMKHQKNGFYFKKMNFWSKVSVPKKKHYARQPLFFSGRKHQSEGPLTN